MVGNLSVKRAHATMKGSQRWRSKWGVGWDKTLLELLGLGCDSPNKVVLSACPHQIHLTDK